MSIVERINGWEWWWCWSVIIPSIICISPVNTHCYSWIRRRFICDNFGYHTPTTMIRNQFSHVPLFYGNVEIIYSGDPRPRISRPLGIKCFIQFRCCSQISRWIVFVEASFIILRLLGKGIYCIDSQALLSRITAHIHFMGKFIGWECIDEWTLSMVHGKL